jgi:hypothetical protein
MQTPAKRGQTHHLKGHRIIFYLLDWNIVIKRIGLEMKKQCSVAHRPPSFFLGV